jgi:hypothetical protein
MMASLLDEKVAGLFWITKQMFSDSSNISSAQKKWLKEKRDVCKTAECAITAYEERYRELIQQIGTRLHPLPQNSSWDFATPWQNAPNSYCVRFGDKKGTRDYFDIYLSHDGKTLCGKGYVVIDCGLRIQSIEGT